MKKTVAALLLTALLAAGWLTTPPPLVATPASVTLDDDLGNQFSAPPPGLVPGTEKRLLWAGVPGERTEYAVIFVHGFSASRQEIAPVPERVAAALGANLFETRLTGHGFAENPLADVAAEQWLDDGAEALAVGARLGDKLVVIGSSTGATLALALAGHPDFDRIHTLVLMSPNHGPKDPASVWLTRPFGPLIARAMIGEYRGFRAANEAQARYWSTRYPTAALVEMMRLVDRANERVREANVPRALLIYSPEDRVVAIDRLLAAFEALPAAVKEADARTETADPGRHVLAGDILSPATTPAVVSRIAEFVLAGDGAG